MTDCKHIHTSVYIADGSRMCHDCGNEIEPPGTYAVANPWVVLTTTVTKPKPAPKPKDKKSKK